MFRFAALLLGALVLALPAQAAALRPATKPATPAHATAPQIKPATKTQKAQAAPTEANVYRRAFAAIVAGNAEQAEALASQGNDPILTKVVRGYAMALPGNDYSFDQLNRFIADNPGWPGLKGIQMIAEQKIPANAAPAQIVAWFSAHPAVTLAGFYRAVEAMNQAGQAQSARQAIRARWIENDFSAEEQTAFLARFGSLLDGNATWARVDRLLWKNDTVEVRQMLPYLSSTDRAIAEARMALASQDAEAESWLDRVPSDGQNDPGLLFQRLRLAVKNNRNDDAAEILLNAPAELGKPEAWWEQRQIVARRALLQQDYALAYRLASQHGQTESKEIASAEFLSGWLALRFLNKPDVALQHFQNLYDTSSTPMSRARGAYWRGRAYETLGNKNEAEQAYQDAAIYNATFYGQMATTRLYAAPTLTAKADPPLPETARRAFLAKDSIRAIERLASIGENDRARIFFRAATDAASKRADFIVLTEIAGRLHRPDWSIQTVKAANQKNMTVYNGGFPLLTVPTPTPPEAAFTHALIRQESMFNPDATSGVGARGLMQLMPRTAQEVAKKIGVKYNASSLDEPGYNIQLGTAFVQQQIDRFDGSYVLALAGYNAGPRRAREWVEAYGDPRKGAVDPVDWIEMIPLQETRNYVQRIIESLQVYRAKLAGGTAPLLILNDISR